MPHVTVTEAKFPPPKKPTFGDLPRGTLLRYVVPDSPVIWMKVETRAGSNVLDVSDGHWGYIPNGATDVFPLPVGTQVTLEVTG
jgi:hypothetical protein